MMQAVSGRTWARALLACGALLVAATLARADVAIPPLQARVTDLTATLSTQQQAALEEKLRAFEARKGSQIAVLIVPTTQPETVEQYAVRVEESWKLGRKGVDDGVLLLVAKDDRKLRIEVGYGLEGALNDATAKRIIAEDITPRFKQNDFAGGINAGVDRIIKVIDGEPLPPPQARLQPSGGGIDINTLLFVGFILVFVVGGILRAIFGRALGAGIIGGLAGVIAWTLGGAVLIAILAAVVAFIFSLLGGTRGGFGGGGFGGGGFSSGGFGGGGGFSGGGGSSGGGGASGSW